jgi:hypothetical protein
VPRAAEAEKAALLLLVFPRPLYGVKLEDEGRAGSANAAPAEVPNCDGASL